MANTDALTLAVDKVIETKRVGGHVTSCKEMERNGVKVGIVEGYIATWDIDRGDWWGVKDQFVQGAFAESLNDLRMRKRQVRLKDHHGRTVGGFPIDTVKEDSRGLFGVGEINLEVQQGREAYALAKQGVLVDFSVGFSIEESSLDEQEDLRTIMKATLWEGSIVDEPMNPFANITAVKSLAKEIASDLCKKDGVTVGEPEMERLIQGELKRLADVEAKRINFRDLEKLTVKDIEAKLKLTSLFSNNVCKVIATKLFKGESNAPDTTKQDGATPEGIESNSASTLQDGKITPEGATDTKQNQSDGVGEMLAAVKDMTDTLKATR